jgi:hypothetical protein
MSAQSFDPVISMVTSCISVETSDVPLHRVLTDIRKGRWREQIADVRGAYRGSGKATANQLKKQLPGVTFSGRFGRRNGNDLISHSGMLCLDLDGIGPGLLDLRKRIESDSWTYASFISPTATGLKVLYRIADDPQLHGAAFSSVSRYVMTRHHAECDPSGRDLARLCFVSHDPNLYWNPDAQIYKCDTDTQDMHDTQVMDGGLCVCVSVSHPDVMAVLEQTQPSGSGQRHRCVFKLARGLKFNAKCAHLPMSELRKIVHQWHSMALPYITTKEFSETWADFANAWSYVHTALDAGTPVTKAWQKVLSEPLPTVCAGYDSQSVRELLALCYHLKGDNGDFFLSMPCAGALIEKHPFQIRRYLKMFQADGLLTIIRKGTRKDATTYKWLG